jgi:hypothetical protein
VRRSVCGDPRSPAENTLKATPSAGKLPGSDSRFEVELVMPIDLDKLPADTALLHRLVRDQRERNNLLGQALRR